MKKWPLKRLTKHLAFLKIMNEQIAGEDVKKPPKEPKKMHMYHFRKVK